ncbi:MAG TPA: SDR family NAD(P)-dependent oxidoreductase, partial [Nannocystis sp.]
SLRRGEPERRSLLLALGALYVHGAQPAWRRVAAQGRRVELPTYPFQRQRHWNTSAISSVPTLGHGAEVTTPEDQGASLFHLRWISVPRPDGERGLAGTWLLFAGDGVADIAATMVAAGLRVITVAPGPTFTRPDPDHVTLDPTRPEHIDQLFTALAVEGVRPGGCVYMGGSGPADALDETVTAGALLLARALLAQPWVDTCPLWFVTRGVHGGDASDEAVIRQAPLWGLGRVLQSEAPALGCRLLDLDAADLTGPGAALMRELRLEDGENQVRWRGGVREVARLLPHAVGPAAPVAAGAAHFDPDGTYLITGGLGGLGRALAAWLLGHQGVKHLVLTGRREPDAEAVAWLTTQRAGGARVEVIAADIGDPAQVDALLATMARDLPPLVGVFHLAAVLDDATIANQNVARLQAVLAPKLRGAWHLHRATASLRLQHFVLFSSAAGVFGTPGQANYAAANAGLDALAELRRQRGLAGLSLAWGPWAELGKAAEQSSTTQQRWRAMGLEGISVEQGMRAMTLALAGNEACATVLAVRRTGLEIQGLVPPLLRRIARNTGHATGRLLDRLRASDPGRRLGVLEMALQTLVIQRLGLRDANQLGPETPLFDLGMDSLMATELRQALSDGLAHPLPPTLIYEHKTIQAIAAWIFEHVLPVVQPRGPAPAPEVAAPAPTPRAGNPWLFVPVPRPGAELRLICLPYAGGFAQDFAPWARLVPEHIEVCAVQSPARRERQTEPWPRTFDELVDELVVALRPHLDRPFAILGHCLGAIVGYEVVRRLTEQGGPQPLHFFAAGALPPHQYMLNDVAARSDESLLALLQLLDTPRLGTLASEPALLRAALEFIRGDFRLATSYRHRKGAPLDLPITVFAGLDDMICPHTAMDPWSRHGRDVRVVRLPGSHYFIESRRPVVIDEVLAVLSQPRSPAPTLPGDDDASITLIAVPGIGGAGSDFAPLVGLVGPGITVISDDPGVGIDNVAVRAEALVAQVRARATRRYALLGHDLGALVAYEAIRRLRAVGDELPAHLFVLAAMAPHVSYVPPIGDRSGPMLVDALTTLGVPVRADAAPAQLRADFRALASYVWTDETALDTPISACLGVRDTIIPEAALTAWDDLTTRGLTVHRLDAGHDLPAAAPVAIASIVARALSGGRVIAR